MYGLFKHGGKNRLEQPTEPPRGHEDRTRPPPPLTPSQKIRVGRGRSSRRPRTSGRGMIGQKARENIPPGFTGGETPIYLRVPKHGMSRRCVRARARVR